MANKLRANAKCPCGSGLKYKKCCRKKGINYNRQGKSIDASEQESVDGLFFSQFNKIEMAATIAALSLDPRNHGKNLRLDHLAIQNLVHGGSSNAMAVSTKKLKRFVDKNYPHFYMEDPPSELFTDNIRSSIGNNTVYNGNFTRGSFILNTLVEAVNFFQEELPERFVRNFKGAARALLLISDVIAKGMGHTWSMEGGYYESENLINIPRDVDEQKLNLLIPMDFLTSLMKNYGIADSVLSPFFLKLEDTQREYSLGDLSNPLFIRPLLRINDGLLVVCPTSIVSAIVHYSWSLATQMDCQTKLATFYQEIIGRGLDFAMSKLRLERLELPSSYDEESSPTFLSNRLYVADKDKLFHISVIQDDCSSYESTTFNHQPEVQSAAITDDMKKSFVCVKEEYPNHQIAQVTLFSGIGRSKPFLFESFDAYYSLVAPVQQLFLIAETRDHERLSLWYFIDACKRLEKSTVLPPMVEVIDLYSLYLKNDDSFYLSDKARPDFLALTDGGLVINKKAKDLIDKRLAYKYIAGHKRPVLVPVLKIDNYVPRYGVLESLGRALEIFIPNYCLDLWIVFHKPTESNPSLFALSWQFSEAIAFWLNSIIGDLDRHLSSLGKLSFEIEVRFTDQDTFFNSDNRLNSSLEEVVMPGVFIENDHTLVFEIHGSVGLLISTNDNGGEREMLKILLQGFGKALKHHGKKNTLTSTEIEKIVNAGLPLGDKKMILSTYTFDNIALNPANVERVRYIQETRVQWMMDRTLDLLGDKCPPVGEIQSRLSFARSTTFALLKELRSHLNQYDGKSFIDFCMRQSDSHLHESEKSKLRTPTRLACFKEQEDTIKEITKSIDRSDKTTLPIRCLIEHLVAEQPKGSKDVTLQAFDDAIAIMSLIIYWGGTGDQIHHSLFDIELAILPSKRVGTNSKEIISKFFTDFKEARAGSYVDQAKDNFDKYFTGDRKERSEIPEFLDESFKKEYGVSLYTLGGVISFLSVFAIDSNTLLMAMPKEKLIQEIINDFEGQVSSEEARNAIEFFTLKKRGKVDSFNPPFTLNDIFPWGYNRRLSYLQRPLIAWGRENDLNPLIMWTPRHCELSWTFIITLIQNDRLKVPEGNSIQRAISKYSKQRSRSVSESFINWLNTSNSIVIEEEVVIGPKGKLYNSELIGDCDLLLIDHDKKSILSIECKRTVSAKNPKQMVEEISQYFGGYFDKHLRRDSWLKDNRKIISDAYGHDVSHYQIYSIFLTYELMAIQFIRKGTLPMPMISLSELRNLDYDAFFGIASKDG